MTLAAGAHFGPYEILSPLGAGGMGEVYRAKDTRLDRDVAIKVLTDTFARDPERVARFQREAKVLASLNHPNIAAIHGFEESEGKRFLVLELVEGDTLAERLRGGAMPVDESLAVCKQMAEALEAAHERGVIHRDLKPANVKITPDGTVKVLDFGLAKALAAEPTDSAPADSPTITANYTRPGVVLGTAAYMSPEQARGKPMDKRTDIWAFGCVLYEALTGQRPFKGETASDTLARILEGQPDWQALPDVTPANIRVMLRRCLEKDANRRLHDMADARIEITETINQPASEPPMSAALISAPSAARRSLAIPWILAGLMALLATIAASLAIRGRPGSSAPVPRPIMRFVINHPSPEPIDPFTTFYSPIVALSADGIHLAYAAAGGGAPRLHLRRMDQFEATPLPGTEGASGPFFSPDGHWIGFFAKGKLKKVPVAGGTPQTLCDAPAPCGASWGPDDTILFAPSTTSGLVRISAAGGQVDTVTSLDPAGNETMHRWPEILPGGKAALFTVRRADDATFDDASIAVVSLETGERRVVLERGSQARYAPTGHLVYHRAGSLMAVPFDLNELEATGSPVQVQDGVLRRRFGGTAHWTLSRHGTLVYAPAPSSTTVWPPRQIVWLSRNGETRPLIEEHLPFTEVRISPDGQRMAVTIDEAPGPQIWIYDLTEGGSRKLKLTFQGGNIKPVWSPDGRWLAFSSSRAGSLKIFKTRADGSGAPNPLIEGEHIQLTGAWSPDGKLLAWYQSHPETGLDIWLLEMDGDSAARPFVRTPYREWGPVFSPDGKWLAFISDESGQAEVYVQELSGSGRKWPISIGGGSYPVWSPKGGELFYRSGDKLMAAAITTEPTFSAGTPVVLAEGFSQTGPPTRGFDVAPDGERFAIIEREDKSFPRQFQLNVVVNWFEEIKRLVPTKTGR